MPIVDKDTLKSYFNDGDLPVESNYIDLIDSMGTAGPHAPTHQSGGNDPIKLDDLATPDDNTDLNVSISMHGLTPKAPNDIRKFLRGDGVWEESSVAWTDYSAVSTIVGWSSFTTKKIFYKQVGKTVYVQFDLEGPSNSTITSFTLPYYQQSSVWLNVPIRVVNNGALAIGFLQLVVAENIVTAKPDMAGSAWTASGTKVIIGQFWYHAQ